jgi:phosphopantetheinyl transferase
LKEAYIKATGTGLSQSLRDIIFHFDPLRVRFGGALSADPASRDPNDWRFEQSRVGTRHIFAVAWRGEPARVVFQTVRLDWLLACAGETPSGLAAIVTK